MADFALEVQNTGFKQYFQDTNDSDLIVCTKNSNCDLHYGVGTGKNSIMTLTQNNVFAYKDVHTDNSLKASSLTVNGSTHILTSGILPNVALSNSIDATNARFDGGNFSGCTFGGTLSISGTLRGGILSNCALVGTSTLAGAISFNNATFTGTLTSSSVLKNVAWSNANVDGMNGTGTLNFTTLQTGGVTRIDGTRTCTNVHFTGTLSGFGSGSNSLAIGSTLNNTNGTITVTGTLVNGSLDADNLYLNSIEFRSLYATAFRVGNWIKTTSQTIAHNISEDLDFSGGTTWVHNPNNYGSFPLSFNGTTRWNYTGSIPAVVYATLKVFFSAAAAGWRLIYIKVNDTTVYGSQSCGVAASSGLELSSACYLILNPGDYVTLRVYEYTTPATSLSITDSQIQFSILYGI